MGILRCCECELIQKTLDSPNRQFDLTFIATTRVFNVEGADRSCFLFVHRMIGPPPCVAHGIVGVSNIYLVELSKRGAS